MNSRIFLILLLMFVGEARAEMTLELGLPLLSGEHRGGGALLVTDRWGGPYGSRYVVGLGYISEQEVNPTFELPSDVRENLYVSIQRRMSFTIDGCPDWDCISIGLGVAYFNGTNRALGSNFNVALSVEVRPDKRWSVNLRHYSNAGSDIPNMGQDMITLGYTF